MQISVKKVNEPKIIIEIGEDEIILTEEQAKALRGNLCNILGEPEYFRFIYRSENPIPPYKWTCTA